VLFRSLFFRICTRMKGHGSLFVSVNSLAFHMMGKEFRAQALAV